MLTSVRLHTFYLTFSLLLSSFRSASPSLWRICCPEVSVVSSRGVSQWQQFVFVSSAVFLLKVYEAGFLETVLCHNPLSFVSLDGWYTSEPRPLLVAFSHRNIGKMRLKITFKLFLSSLTLFSFFFFRFSFSFSFSFFAVLFLTDSFSASWDPVFLCCVLVK